MPQYLVRVELFGANSEHYERLHANMDAMGIEREITFDDQSRRQMPAGTYFGFRNLSLASVHDKVQKVADPLSPAKPAAIFVAATKDGEWSAFLYPA
ncbi:DUF2622 domain-containing protein [Pseudomonas syringae group genomosp. 3]|uniref:DUF2622 domain-containing protein n=1 Tax=Pseudomonas syringae group genomosp. 3 TaxID=251701 RepID=UPI0011C34BA8|nr:DUF2622 domain-containing protein [Pseudomonas syringae group genomosp. 3]